MKKCFLLSSFICVSIFILNAQLIKNDFLVGYKIGDPIEKAAYGDGISSRDPIKINQWNLTRIPDSRSGNSPKAVAALTYQDYIESGKDVAIEITRLADGYRSTVYSLADNDMYGPGTYYLAFMMNIDFIRKMPVEFFSFDADYAGSTQRVRFSVQGLSKTFYQMGLNGTNRIENALFTESAYNTGETNLVVLKVTFDSEGNGRCEMFINPDPVVSEPTPSISTDLVGLKAIKGITIRQRKSSVLAARIGGIRFTKSWNAIFK